MLHNVYAALVAERGFSKTALTNPDTTEGNVVYMHLLIDALLLQPCNPTCEFSWFLTDASLTSIPQSWMRAMHGSKPTRTDTTAPTNVPYSRRLQAVVLGLTLLVILSTTETSPLAAD